MIAHKMGLLSQVLLTILLGATVRCGAEPAPRAETNATHEGWGPRRWAQNERVPGEQMGGRLIDRLLVNAKLTSEIGLTEETVAKLREEAHVLQVRHQELEAQIEKLSLAQADHMSKLMQSSEASTNDVMKGVEEIGRLRTEQAKLAVQNMILVRKYLTPEQIRKARELMRARMQNNGEARPGKKEKAAAGAPPAKPPEGW